MNQSQYKAIFFDWDGTAVSSRKAPVDEAAALMKSLLAKGVKLVVVSGTTYENIAGGRLHEYFTPEELKHLWLGLGRGAYNYRYHEDGTPYIWKHCIPEGKELLAIHDTAYAIHRELLNRYHYPTDVVFSRPNYCKIDLMADSNRGDQLFFQSSELEQVKQRLETHGFHEGLLGLVKRADEIASEYGVKAASTTDAKYLEVGISSKSDNVDAILALIMEEDNILPENCVYWGDEYIGLDDGLFGSDSYMITSMTKAGEFYDVSEALGMRPAQVQVLGGGVKTFLEFLQSQI